MSYRLRLTRRAEQDIEMCGAWWKKHREKAPKRFANELEKAFRRLRTLPLTGQPYERRRFPAVRRLHLKKTPYHLYYVVKGEEVIVITLWSGVRKRGLTLKGGV